MTELLSPWPSPSTMWGRLSSLRQLKSLRYRTQNPLPLLSPLFYPYCLHVSQSASVPVSPFSCSLPDLHLMLPFPFVLVLVLLQLLREAVWSHGKEGECSGGREGAQSFTRISISCKGCLEQIPISCFFLAVVVASISSTQTVGMGEASEFSPHIWQEIQRL